MNTGLTKLDLNSNLIISIKLGLGKKLFTNVLDINTLNDQ